jgi:acetolactate synthase-1/2/3 large subunit
MEKSMESDPIDSQNGAELLVTALRAIGVRTIFTLSGNQIMPVFDACIDADMRLIHVRHEAAAVYMAEAWAQLNGDIGVALIPAGPGFVNGLSPLYSARASESPVLLLSGDAPLQQDSMGAFQQLDQVSISKPLTKFSRRPQSVDDISRDLAKAISIARSGRPGPVHLALPFDLLCEQVSFDAEDFVKRANRQENAPETRIIEQIADTLVAAERPLVLAGPALSQARAGAMVSELQENLGVPVISMENPRGLKDPALGNLGEIMAKADVVLLLGKAVDFMVNFGQSPGFNPICQFLAIDPEQDLLNQAKRALADQLVISQKTDADLSAKALSLYPAQPPDRHRDWRNQVTHACASRAGISTTENQSTPLHPATLCESVQRVIELADDPVLICDGGEFGQWAQAFTHTTRRIINGPAGAIGGGICYAVAAKICHPESSVFVLMGDGTAGFHLSEFETAIRYGLPFVAIIGNDSRWNAEYQIQLREYGAQRLRGCELGETRYDQVVRSLGGYGEFVDHPEQLEAALERALQSGLPACVNVRIEGLPAPTLSS